LRCKALSPLLLLILASCASLELEKKEVQTYRPLEIPEKEVETENIEPSWPVPQIEPSILLYPPLLLTQDGFTLFEWPVAELSETTTHKVPENRDTPPVVVVRPPDPDPAPVPVPAPTPTPAPAPEPVWEEKKMEEPLSPESDITLELPGGGWSFLGIEPEQPSFQLMEQFQGLEKSRFLFSPLTLEGRYVLRFTKQDPSTGRNKGIRYQIIILDSQEEDQTLSVVPEEQNKEDLLKEMLNLREKNESPEKMIPLLEDIIRYDWNNEEYAGYLYELALQLEKNGVTQDLERAFSLYERIQEEFFLSSYYEKAGDRMLYLNRHFFLLQ